MKKIYLHLLNSMSIAGLIALSPPTLAETFQPIDVSLKQVLDAEATSTTARVSAAQIAAIAKTGAAGAEER